MRAFIPHPITDAMLVSSSINEPSVDAPLFDSNIIYSEGQLISIIETDKHLVYESLQDGNQGHPPHLSTTWWILKGATNRWAMFDYNTGSPSIAPSPLTIVIRPGKRIDAVALEGIKAGLLDITVKNGIDGPTVFMWDGLLLDRQVTTPYEWAFSQFVYTKIAATFAVPPVADPVIYLTLTDNSGVVELGRLAIGSSVYFGVIDWNPIVDSDNYSTIEYDAFGKATLFPIPSIPTNELKVMVKHSKLNVVRQFKERANAKAAVWSGLDDIISPLTEPLVIFGVYRNFQIDISNPGWSVINLSLKGV